LSHPSTPSRPRRASRATGRTRARGGTLNALNPYSLNADGWCEPTESRATAYDRQGPPADPRAAFAKNASAGRAAIAKSIEVLSREEPLTIDYDVIALRFLTHPRRDIVSALFPLPSKARRAALLEEVAAVTVRTANGDPTPLRNKLDACHAITRREAARILAVLADLRHAWTSRAADSGYDDVNWKHACAEVGQILDTADDTGLDARTTEDAVLASLISDSAKLRGNFLTHHVDGAVGAAVVLPRFIDVDTEAGRQHLASICQAILEHQVGPPRFMAAMVRMGIESALRKKHKRIRPEDALVLTNLQKKIADPLNPAHVRLHVEGYGVLRVTDAEAAMLDKVGLPAWYVPHPTTPWFAASSAVIDADSLVNYVTPDGVGKIVAITGPGTPFRDATVFHSIFSCGASFVDAVSVMSDGAMAAVEDGVLRTRKAIEAMRASVSAEIEDGWLHFPRAGFSRVVEEERVDVTQLRAVERDGEVLVDVPWLEDAELPYWNIPLDYDTDGASLEFAKLVRRRVADLLREH
jgi:hypothetical protein